MTALLRPRLATLADVLAVEEIVQRAYSPYIPRIGRPPGPMLDDYKSLINSQKVHVLDHNGTVGGFVILLPQEDAMLLDNVAVSPSAQRMGLGRRLLAFAEEAAKAAGFRSIKLYTNEAMTENVVLYKRIGYVETHRAEEKGLKRIYMSKKLS